jgi:hypothetical protein
MFSKLARILSSVCLLCLVESPANLTAATLPLAWRWSNPYPHGNNIIDMAYGNGLAVQVAERGQIYTSVDSQSWIPRDSHTTLALRAVTFLNGRVIITGENGTVLYADAPSDFKLVSLGTADWLEAVAASPNLLVAVGDNAAIYTSGDGITWQRRNAPFGNWLRGVAFGAPAGTGTFVAVGETGLVATSSGLRPTWTALHSRSQHRS